MCSLLDCDPNIPVCVFFIMFLFVALLVSSGLTSQHFFAASIHDCLTHELHLQGFVRNWHKEWPTLFSLRHRRHQLMSELNHRQRTPNLTLSYSSEGSPALVGFRTSISLNCFKLTKPHNCLPIWWWHWLLKKFLGLVLAWKSPASKSLFCL